MPQQKDETMEKLTAKVSKHTNTTLRGMSALTKVPIARLLAIAIDNEFEREFPFQLDTTLPEDGCNEFEFAHEAGLLVDFMKTTKNTGIDVLMLLRKDIGIPDRATFLAAFKECIDREVIVPFEPRKTMFTREYPDNYYHFKLKEEKTAKKKRKAASRYNKRVNKGE